MKKKTVIALLLALTALHLHAQTMVESIVTDGETGEALPFAHIYRQGRLTTLSNMQGAFALEAGVNDTIQISYMGYRSRKIAASELAREVRLQSSAHYLPEVVVMPVEDLMGKIIKKTDKAVRKRRNAKSTYFYRQSTFVDGTQRNLMEAFFDARSALTASSVRLIIGRIAEGGDVFYGADLYRLSQIWLLKTDVNKPAYIETIVPLDKHFNDYYETSLREVEFDNRTLYEIRFAPGDSTLRKNIVTGMLYVNKEQLLPVKMKGSIENLTVVHRSIEGNIDGERLPIDISFDASFDTEHQFPEVISIVVNAAYEDAHHSYRFVSLLYNTGQQKIKTRNVPEYIYDLRKQIKRHRFSRTFWSQHEMLKRTDIERMLHELQGE